MIENCLPLTRKILLDTKYNNKLDNLLFNAKLCVKRMLENRSNNSSKYYKELPCVLAKGLIRKYQKNKKCKCVKNIVLPICGDKGKQVKIVDNGIRISSIFGKDIIYMRLPHDLIGNILHIELIKSCGKWHLYYMYNRPMAQEYHPQSYLGVDRNIVGNVATVADASNGKVMKIGPSAYHISKSCRNRRIKLEKKGVKNALKKIRRKQSNRTKDINHKVSRSIVDYAKLHCSAIVLEDLSRINKGKTKKYAKRSQWSFYQLETFIKYKAALLGVPILYVDPAYTSQICSRCGSINKPNGKQYRCFQCGHFDHRDVNAAFNISKLGDQLATERDVVKRFNGNPLNWSTEKAVQPKLLVGGQ